MLKGEAIFDVVLLSDSRIHQMLRFIVHGFSQWCERCRAADPLRESLLENNGKQPDFCYSINSIV